MPKPATATARTPRAPNPGKDRRPRQVFETRGKPRVEGVVMPDLDFSETPMVPQSQVDPAVAEAWRQKWKSMFTDKSFFTIQARGRDGLFGLPEYAHEVVHRAPEVVQGTSSSVELTFNLYTPFPDGTEMCQTLTPAEIGRVDATLRKRREEVLLNSGSIIMSAFQHRDEKPAGMSKGQQVFVLKMDADKPRTFFSVALNPENPFSLVNGPHIVPQVGDTVCARVTYQGGIMVLADWFICSEQLIRLVQFLRSGDFISTDNEKFAHTGYLDTDVSRAQQRRCMAGSNLCPGGFSKNLVRLATNDIYPSSDVPEHVKAFEDICRDYARTRVEYDCKWPHIYAFFFQMINNRLLPSGATVDGQYLTNVPQNLGPQYFNNFATRARVWILPQLTEDYALYSGDDEPTAVPERCDVFATDGTMRWVEALIAGSPVTTVVAPVPQLLFAPNREQTRPSSSSEESKTVPVLSMTDFPPLC